MRRKRWHCCCCRPNSNVDEPRFEMTHFNRRHLLISAAALASPISLALAATAPNARPDDARFVFVLLRGGMDGLAAVPAIGDPDFAAARGPLANFGAPPLPLDGTPFALHPALGALHGLYRGGELAVVHAVGLAYRERSHFDAQQVLESGGSKPYELATGWLGRALAAHGNRAGLALTTAVPLVLRGSEHIDTWAPSALPEPSPDLVARLESLYAGDAALGAALARAKALREQPGMSESPANGGGRAAAIALARKAGDMLAAAQGPRVAVLEMGGWDTHANQAAPAGALANNLRNLGARWRHCAKRRRARPGHAPSSSSPRSSAAKWPSTARRAPTTAQAARPSCSAARCTAAACSATGQGWPAHSASRAAICASPRTCAACSRACSASTCAWPRAPSSRRCSRTPRPCARCPCSRADTDSRSFVWKRCSAFATLLSYAGVRNSFCADVCAHARLRAGQHRGSDSTPRCAGSAAVLALRSC
jgi:hypothetical protein